jgi:two-component system chemotaxis response regulator CheY
LDFAPGSVIELDKLVGEALDILANGKKIATGEVVVVDENYGIKITDIIVPEQRLSKISFKGGFIMANGIFVVDDAAFMRMMIKDVLTKNGYEILGEAENGQKAIEKFKELNPDLVIMDITMPEVDGIQAVKEIKKIDSSAKIIMCSAMGQQAMVIESIQAGARDFIVKPFQADRVVEAVKKVIG